MWKGRRASFSLAEKLKKKQKLNPLLPWQHSCEIAQLFSGVRTSASKMSILLSSLSCCLARKCNFLHEEGDICSPFCIGDSIAHTFSTTRQIGLVGRQTGTGAGMSDVLGSAQSTCWALQSSKHSCDPRPALLQAEQGMKC